MAKGNERMVRRSSTCPICGKETEARWRPFCSKRCADLDLNRWLSGQYAVPVVEDDDEEAAFTPTDPSGDERH